MEIRALAIAFFYAVGTAIGGITGPLVFEKLGESGDVGQVMIAYLIGAAVMAVGGIAELFLGVRAEQQPLENIAKPITAREAEEGTPPRNPTKSVRRPRRRSAASARAGSASARAAPIPARTRQRVVLALPVGAGPARTRAGSTTRSGSSDERCESRESSTARIWPAGWAPVTGVRAGSGRRCAGGCRGSPRRVGRDRYGPGDGEALSAGPRTPATSH